jgi:hypothetical protein
MDHATITVAFCYIPMGSSDDLTENYDTDYHPYRDAVSAFIPDSAHPRAHWPSRLPKQGHFDPDFMHLSYGDVNQRGKQISSHLAQGDFIVFYAGLRSVHTGNLCYSIIGFYAIDAVLPCWSIPPEDRHRNAHTLNGCTKDKNDIVVFGRPGESGRLLKHIPIGEYRRRAYRVRQDILDEWGGLDVKDGYIQRSVFLPSFTDGEKFLRWFRLQNPELLSVNNP